MWFFLSYLQGKKVHHSAEAATDHTVWLEILRVGFYNVS